MQAPKATTTDRIYEFIKGQPATAPEIAKALRIPMGTATSRTSTLLQKGKIYGMGRRHGSRIYSVISIEIPKVRLKNHFVMVLDHSGSMSGAKAVKATQLVNAQVRRIQKARDQESVLTSFHFGGDVRKNLDAKPIGEVGVLYDWLCRGETPLRDAVIAACRHASEGSDGETSFVVLVFTDGLESSSRASEAELKSLIRSLQDTGRWTFAFLVPKEGGKQAALDAGVPEGNIQTWDGATGSDLLEVEQKTSGGTQTFLEGRRAGKRQTKHYFAADLSNLDQSLGLLQEVSKDVSVYETKKETTIEDFFLEKVPNERYAPGTGFYEVMKREKLVKADRGILLLDRRDGKVYGDGTKSVRALAGYPERGDVAIQPGNHGNFTILVQSKSSKADTFRARILPRGTKVAFATYDIVTK